MRGPIRFPENTLRPGAESGLFFGPKHLMKKTWKEELRIPELVETFDDDAGTFKGIASKKGSLINTVPLTIIEAGAFTKTLKERGPNFPLLWQHNPDWPIGSTEPKETDRGLENDGEIIPTNYGKDAIMVARHWKKKGVQLGQSIGFDPIKFDFLEDEKLGTIRRLKEIRLWEISLVTWGADPRACVIEVHAVNPFKDLRIDESRKWDAAQARTRLEAWAKGDTERLGEAYVYRVPEGESMYLPIADLDDQGNLVVVPEALFEAALALDKLPVTPEEKAKCREHLTAYYHKLDRTAPWEGDAFRLLLEPIASVGGLEINKGKILSAKSKGLVSEAIGAAKAVTTALQALLDHAEPLEDPDEGHCALGPEPQPDPAALFERLARLNEAELAYASLLQR